MANLKEIRGRITSVNSTRQITSAMKMVSAAKLRRAQDAVIRMRPYAEKMGEILQNLSLSLDTSEGIYTSEREVENVLLLPITSNKGLCGAFNATVIRKTNELIREYQDKNVTVLSVGKKSSDYFKKTDYNIKGSRMPRQLDDLYNDLTFDNVAPVMEKIMEAYRDKQFDKVVLVYNRFKNAAVQILMVEQLLPVLPPEMGEEQQLLFADYIFEPGKKEILEDLIPKSLKTQFYKALLDSHAAEHGARMTAMHSATDNATDLLRDLKLTYNKARQAAITTEILEIVGGAEALSKG